MAQDYHGEPDMRGRQLFMMMDEAKRYRRLVVRARNLLAKIDEPKAQRLVKTIDKALKKEPK